MRNDYAMTLGEGHYSERFRVDASLTFDSPKSNRKYVLRTVYEDYPEYLSKLEANKDFHQKIGLKPENMAPIKRRMGAVEKTAAYAGNDQKNLWVFKVNATMANDIFNAVKIAMSEFNTDARDLISDVYVKNLNVNNENAMDAETRIRANRKLYTGTCRAIVEAAKLLGLSEASLNFWVLSNIKNPKIPMKDLHEAMLEGGADEVSYSKDPIKTPVMSNNMNAQGTFKNHLHLSRFHL